MIYLWVMLSVLILIIRISYNVIPDYKFGVRFTACLIVSLVWPLILGLVVLRILKKEVFSDR